MFRLDDFRMTMTRVFLFALNRKIEFVASVSRMVFAPNKIGVFSTVYEYCSCLTTSELLALDQGARTDQE